MPPSLLFLLLAALPFSLSSAVHPTLLTTKALIPRQFNPKPGFLGSCTDVHSTAVSNRKDVYDCAQDLIKFTDPLTCEFPAGQSEKSIASCFSAQITVTMARKRVTRTRLSCKDIGIAVLEVVENCAGCAMDSCPVEGRT